MQKNVVRKNHLITCVVSTFYSLPLHHSYADFVKLRKTFVFKTLGKSAQIGTLLLF